MIVVFTRKKINNRKIHNFVFEWGKSVYFHFFLLFFFEINCQHDTTRNDMTIVYCWRLSGKQDEFMVNISKTENYTHCCENKKNRKKKWNNFQNDERVALHCTLNTVHWDCESPCLNIERDIIWWPYHGFQWCIRNWIHKFVQFFIVDTKWPF